MPWHVSSSARRSCHPFWRPSGQTRAIQWSAFHQGTFCSPLWKTKSFITTFIASGVMTARCCYPVTCYWNPDCSLQLSLYSWNNSIERVKQSISVRSIITFEHFSQYFVLMAAGRSFMGFTAAHRKSNKIEGEIWRGGSFEYTGFVLTVLYHELLTSIDKYLNLQSCCRYILTF